LRVYLRCEAEKEKLLRDILEVDFVVGSLEDEDLSRPSAGDVVLVDLTYMGYDWRDDLAGLRHALNEGVRLVAVLGRGQLHSVDGHAPLDDFVAEGSTPDEIRARLRRQAGDDISPTPALGELEIDEDRYEARVGGVPAGLTYKEFELLRFLMARPGKVFTREILLEQVWGYDYFGGSRTVDVHIRRIRSKIEVEGHTYIRTVRGVGYIFEHKPPE